MIYSVYSIKKDSYIFSGTLRECKEFIDGYPKNEQWYLEIRGGL